MIQCFDFSGRESILLLSHRCTTTESPRIGSRSSGGSPGSEVPGGIPPRANRTSSKRVLPIAYTLPYSSDADRMNAKLCFLSPSTEAVYNIPGLRMQKKKLRAAPRSHPLPSAPALCLYRLRHRKGLESCAPMFNRSHQSLFLVLVTFQQRQKRRAVITPSSA